MALRVLHSGVGAINESDVTLARASGGVLIGFNVRANAQARDLAKRDAVEIRYYSVIYDIIDDVRGVLSGLLAPQLRETFLGNAQIREVFNITRVGKVAGCMVTEGMVKRGAKVRLLRDNVVIHEGSLKTLKRFKDEVREVREGFECGMAFENYDDVKAGDVIEAFEVEIGRAHALRSTRDPFLAFYLEAARMPLFVIDLTYVKPLEEVERRLAGHMEVLERGYADGTFLLSGRKNPRTGGVILAKAETREALDALLATDPFHEVARFEITEFAATKSASQLAHLL